MEGARQTAEQRALAALELRASLRERLIDIAWRQEQGELLARQEAVLAQLEAQALSAFQAGRGSESDVLEARLARQARVQGQLQNDTALASAESGLQRWLPDALLQQGPPPTLKALFPSFGSWPTSAAVQQSEALTHYETTLLPLAERHWARSLARFGEGTLPFDRALAAALALLSTQSAALDLNRQRALSESALLFLVAQELDHE
jgi:outer membrane protein TolC